MGYSASALERYTYCPLSWWLSRQGVKGEGDAIKDGHRRHAAKGRLLALWETMRRAYERSFDAATLFTLVASSAALFAIDATLVDPFGPLGVFLLVLALLSLVTALAYLLRAVRARERGESARRKAGIVEGELTYSDLDRPADVLRSERYDISGRPDYVVRRDGHLIPVEVKTGKAPARPHESHVVQAAAYALLVEETSGERPPYAIVSYEDRSFEVPYDEALKNEVLVTALRMRLAEATGDVHRNHDQRGRCAGCSRRAVCPERLV